MAKKTAPLLPSTSRLLEDLGERLRMARLRRRLQAKQVAERAGMSVMTLRAIERGGSGVTMGAYLAVMQVLQLEQDIAEVAKADSMGHRLQDASLVKVMKPRRAPPSSAIKAQDQSPSLKAPAKPSNEAIASAGKISSKRLLLLLNQPSLKE